MRRVASSIASPAALTPRSLRARLLDGADHYDELVQKAIAGAKVSLWIATANVKEMRVEAPIGTAARAKGRFVSILDTLASLKSQGVELRFLHGGVPSRPFREELARQPRLRDGGLPMRMCPRVHLKVVAIDGRLLYLGSANFTGAGLGRRGTAAGTRAGHAHRRRRLARRGAGALRPHLVGSRVQGVPAARRVSGANRPPGRRYEAAPASRSSGCHRVHGRAVPFIRWAIAE